MVVFYTQNKYQSPEFAKNHVALASIIPILGFFLSLVDHKSGTDFLINSGFNVLALLIAGIPLFLRGKTFNANTINDNKASIIPALTLLGATFFGPLSIAAIIVAHTSMKQLSGAKKGFNYAVLFMGYAILAYWLYSMAVFVNTMTS